MAHREGVSFKPRPLGSHVSVREQMALLPHDLPTASQVLTTDLKITIAEANISNLLADDDFQAAAGAFLPTT